MQDKSSGLAVITGASSGIGSVYADRLAAQGVSAAACCPSPRPPQGRRGRREETISSGCHLACSKSGIKRRSGLPRRTNEQRGRFDACK